MARNGGPTPSEARQNFTTSAVLYLVLVWLVFSKLKLVRWGWFSGTVAVLIGAGILSVFLALLNYLTPSGPIVVTGRVVEVQPNVTGQVIAIAVKPNVLVKTGTVPLLTALARFEIGGGPF